jgi:hypothetical protein
VEDGRGGRRGAGTVLIGLLVGVAVVLVAQFMLEGLADEREFWLWLQHGLIFFGGIVVGAAGLRLYWEGQRRA